MSQREVIELLNKHTDKWLTKKEIKRLMEDMFCTQSVNESLARLTRAGIIEVQPCPKLKRGYQYKIRDDLVLKKKD